MVVVPCCQAGLLTWMLLLLLLPSSEVQGECPTPDLPPHSSLKRGEDLADTYPAETVLRLVCNTGYEYIPGRTSVIKCLLSGHWLMTPELCQGRRCPTPHIENGRIVSLNDLRFGDQVTFACDYGFRIIGESTLQCVLKSGRVDWNREVPQCQRIPCGRPSLISNGKYDLNPSDEYDVGTAVIYHCDADYSLIGNSTISCTIAANGVDGMWDSPPPECKKVRCHRPNIQNGGVTNVFQAAYTYDSGISFQCNSGYTLVGAAFVKCDANSKWNPPIPSCVESVVPTPTKPTRPPTPAVPPTPPIPPMPGTVPPEEDETEGIPCDRPPFISNGRYDSSPSDEYDAGSVVIYRCDADYTLIGNSTISCTVAANGVDGMWDSPPPECKKVKCHRPNIQNGRVTNAFQATYAYDNGISFQCNSGYTLVGAAFVKCDANSKWNPPIPSCVESVIPTPTKPTRPPTPAVPPTPPIPPMPGTVPPEEDETEEKSLEDRLDKIEKKLDLILHMLILQLTR